MARGCKKIPYVPLEEGNVLCMMAKRMHIRICVARFLEWASIFHLIFIPAGFNNSARKEVLAVMRTFENWWHQTWVVAYKERSPFNSSRSTLAETSNNLGYLCGFPIQFAFLFIHGN
jgi:hypothetical protein